MWNVFYSHMYYITSEMVLGFGHYLQTWYKQTRRKQKHKRVKGVRNNHIKQQITCRKYISSKPVVSITVFIASMKTTYTIGKKFGATLNFENHVRIEVCIQFHN